MKKTNQGCNRIAVGCTSIVSGYVALCILGWAIVSLNNGLLAPSSVDWPSTRGEVTVSQEVQDDGEPKDRIVYTYHVNDREYTSDRISFQPGRLPPDLRESASRLARFPVETRVTVHYDPDDPQEAVLYPGQGNGLVGYVVAILFLLTSAIFGALGLMLFSWTKEQSHGPKRSSTATSDTVHDFLDPEQNLAYKYPRLR